MDYWYYSLQYNRFGAFFGINAAGFGCIPWQRNKSRYTPLYCSYSRSLQKLGKQFSHNNIRRRGEKDRPPPPSPLPPALPRCTATRQHLPPCAPVVRKRIQPRSSRRHPPPPLPLPIVANLCKSPLLSPLYSAVIWSGTSSPPAGCNPPASTTVVPIADAVPPLL